MDINHAIRVTLRQCANQHGSFLFHLHHLLFHLLKKIFWLGGTDFYDVKTFITTFEPKTPAGHPKYRDSDRSLVSSIPVKLQRNTTT